MQKRLIASLLCGCLLMPFQAQPNASPTMVFQPLGLDEGLSQSTVNVMFQDSLGLIWLGTENGLNRYDGNRIQVDYRATSGGPGLPADFIWDIREDATGDLWLATDGGGLVRWNRNSNAFEPIATDDRQKLARCLHIAPDGRIWVGTRGAGLLEYTPGGALQPLVLDAEKSTSNIISDIAQVGDALFLATDGGLYRWNLRDREARSIPLVDGEQPALSAIWADANALWLGSYDRGLFRFGLSDATVQNWLQADAPDSLSSNEVRDILRDRDGRLWIATQNGLNLHRPETNAFDRFVHAPDDRFSLSNNLTMSLMQSREGVLWIGTRQGGANRWNPRSWDLGSHAPAEMQNAAVLAFADAGDGDVWIGGFGMPLLRLTPDGQVRARFALADGYADRSEAPATALLRDRRQRLWIGTMGAGLELWTPEDRSLRAFTHDADNPASLGADGVMSLYEDRAGSIWVGTFGGGLARIDPETLIVERDASVPGLEQARVTGLSEDLSGRLWIATDGDGLIRRDGPGEGLSLRADAARPSALAMDSLYAIHHDNSGHLWIGTAGAGLDSLSISEQDSPVPQFEHRDVQSGLSSNVINGIRSDTAGQLWLSSNRGLMQMDPASGQLRYFHRSQGLQSEEFNFGAHFRSRDGRIFFGGTSGYNAIDPVALSERGEPPRLLLTGIERFNLPLATEKPYDQMQSLALRHNDDVMTFEFAALDFAAPSKNLYSVKLEGFDRDWTPPSYRHRATYTNLDAGQYTLRVRAANSEGVWATEPLSLDIVVRPAPWASWPAYIAYLLTAIALLWTYLRWRTQVIERNARMRQLAFYDRVTGLPNRELFEQRCREALKQAKADDRALLVFCLQTGPLKRMHEGLSHMSVDDLISSLAKRLSQELFSDHSGGQRELARLGDNEFIIFLASNHPESEALVWAQRFETAIAQPLGLDEHQFRLPARIGIAAYPAHADTVHALIRFAATAAADNQGGGETIRFYEQAMMKRALDRLALESHLRLAIENDGLQLYLQGKFNPAGELVGAEALCRWMHPERGPVSPGVFVPLAEESDLIMALDDWMIGRACRTLHEWSQRGYPPVSIAVNVSAGTFVSGRIFESLSRHQERYPINPALLEIELTESVLANDLDLITDILQKIAALGHTLSLDDFGTGYSSLSYLQRFPLNKLKIDQSFVKGLEHNPNQKSLCSSIVALGQSMGLTTVAEGVETQAEMDYLIGLGCEQLQGYYLHRPEAADGLACAYLAKAGSGAQE